MIAALLWLAVQADPVRPLLVDHCLKCHGGENVKGGLDLRTREALLKGGDSGPAVIPGNSAGSLLYKLVTHADEPAMPRKTDKLSAAAIAQIAAWIDAGVPYDQPLAAATAGRRELVITDEDRQFWSFAPLNRPQPPRAGKWARTDVDRFILGALEGKRLDPSAEADRRTLIRRLSFDLVGLPPTPEEVEAFVRSRSPAAYEDLVDRLLASPRYGERWARHWLDIARYADSEGYRYDQDRKTAYQYRDFVIRALNEDLPFDTFVRWQLAGDELAPEDPRALAATGFLTAGAVVEKQLTDAKRNQEKYRYDELDDMLGTTAQAMLGLTIGCARCHDHKFDPIPTRDYYRLLAAFTTTARHEAFLASPDVVADYKRRRTEFDQRAEPIDNALKTLLERERAPLVRKKVDALDLGDADKALLRQPPDKTNQRQQELLTIHRKQLRVGDPELRKAMAPETRARWEQLAASLTAVERERPPSPPRALGITDASAKPSTSYLLERGQVDLKKEEVTLGFLSVLGGKEHTVTRPAGARTTFQRAALASWLTDPDGGAGRLAARVIVNRLWRHHFGEGLVRTPNDFGTQGERPTHPELLDWLAGQLIAGGWHLKPLHRLIVTSAVYRQGTRFDAEKAAIDPDNKLLWRRRPMRVEAEVLRDAILVVSGRLDPTMYGPGVKLPIPPEAIITRTDGDNHYPTDVVDGPPVWRRTVYAFVKRSVPVPMLEVFDAPSPMESCGRRVATTVAHQALSLLNDPFVHHRAQDFADRIAREAGRRPVAQIDRAYLLAFARPPRADERKAALAFLTTGRLADFAQVLLGLNEFVYIE